MVVVGPVKSKNVTEWKNPTSCYICNLKLWTVLNVYGKCLHSSLRWFLIAPKSAQNPKNSKNRHLSPIFGDKLVNWNMKFQTRHIDISARQSQNTPLSDGDNEKVSCLWLHRWFCKFITKKWGKMTIFTSFDGFATLLANKKPSWRGMETFSNAHLKVFKVTF